MSELKKLPQGWTHATIGELISDGVFTDGDWVESKDQDPSGDVRLLQLADIGDGNFLNKSSRFLTKEKAVALGCTFLQKNDVLIARMPDPLGRACLMPIISQDCVTVVDVCVIRGKHEHFNQSWLMYFINSPDFRNAMAALQSGSTRKRISRGNLAKIKLPIPPRKEHDRIVEKLEELLSELDNGVSELNKAHAKLGLYRQSLLKSAVEGQLTQQWREQNRSIITETGQQLLERILKERHQHWERQKLTEFAEKGKAPPKNWQAKYQEPIKPDTKNLPKLPPGWAWASIDQVISGIEAGKSFKCIERPPEGKEYGVIKISAVTWGEYNENESKTCTLKKHEKPEFLVKEGDFLFSRANTTELVGACVIVEKTEKNVMLSDKIWRIKYASDEIKYWILQCLRGPFGRQQIELAASGNQASMKNISQQKLRGISIPIAPISEIHKIHEVLTHEYSKIKVLADSNSKQIHIANAQRKNILRDAFSGKLVSQNPSEESANALLEKIEAERIVMAEQPKQKHSRKKSEKVIMMETLLEVLKSESDWIDAQEAFKRCGITDNVDTDKVEALFAELRKLDKADQIDIKRVGDFDQIKLKEVG